MAERLGRSALNRRGVKSSSVSTSLGPVHFYDAAGQGAFPTTVLVHGLGSGATPFGPLLGQLRNHVERVIVPDLPGHGFNAPCKSRLTPGTLFKGAIEALDSLVQEPALLVGNSLGGAVALHYAVTRPERVRALVLISPAGAQATEEEWEAIRRTFDVRSRSEASAFLRRLYHRPPWFASLLAHEIPAAFARPSMQELLATASNADAPAPEALASLDMPILLVWGRSERLLPQTHFEYFARHLPHHSIIERPFGFGHCPHFDAPIPLAQRIVAFARQAGLDRPRAPKGSPASHAMERRTA